MHSLLCACLAHTAIARGLSALIRHLAALAALFLVDLVVFFLLVALFLADTVSLLGFTLADLGRATSRTPSSKVALILSAFTLDGTRIER